MDERINNILAYRITEKNRPKGKQQKFDFQVYFNPLSIL